jgi:heme exporter protein A
MPSMGVGDEWEGLGIRRGAAGLRALIMPALSKLPRPHALNANGKALLVEQLEVWRGEQCLIADLGFRVGPGEAALVLGPNGSGKTSMLRVVAGLTPVTAGSVRWGDTAIRALAFDTRGEIAYRGHLEGLKKDLTITENLALYARLWPSREDAAALLGELGLAGIEHRRVRQLSAGQKRRVGLAALRLQGAALWILDEPMTNLDADGRSLVAGWVQQHLDRGGSALIATHQPEDFAGAASLAIDL